MIGASHSARAFDPDKVFGAEPEPHTILRYGYNALKEGRNEEALSAFRFGAVKNNLQSQWKLARMLQHGQGVARDPAAAYELYEKIADRYAEIPPNRNDLPYVSDAVVTIGMARLSGIEGTHIGADPQIAEFYFYRAAALYGDAEAQYQLGKLYSGTEVGPIRPRSAAGWFELASKKGHAGAQAELGQMLFYGKGIRKNRVLGLVYLTRAAASSARGKFSHIKDLQRSALGQANAAQLAAARKILSRLNIGALTDPFQVVQKDRAVLGLKSDVSEATENE